MSLLKRYRGKYYYLCYLITSKTEAHVTFAGLGYYFIWALRGELMEDYVPTTEELLGKDGHHRHPNFNNYRFWVQDVLDNDRRNKSKHAVFGGLLNWFSNWMSFEFYHSIQVPEFILRIKKYRGIKVMLINFLRVHKKLIEEIYILCIKLLITGQSKVFEIEWLKYGLPRSVGVENIYVMKKYAGFCEAGWLKYYKILMPEKKEFDLIGNTFVKKLFIRKDVEYSTQKRFYNLSFFYLKFNGRIRDPAYVKDGHNFLLYGDNKKETGYVDRTAAVCHKLIERGRGWHKCMEYRYPITRTLLPYRDRVGTFITFGDLVSRSVENHSSYITGRERYLYGNFGLSNFLADMYADIKNQLYCHSDVYLNMVLRSLLGRYYLVLDLRRKVKGMKISITEAFIILLDGAPKDIAKIDEQYKLSQKEANWLCYDLVKDSVRAYKRYLKKKDTIERIKIARNICNRLEYGIDYNPYFLFDFMRFQIKCGIMLVLERKGENERFPRKPDDYDILPVTITKFSTVDGLDEAGKRFGMSVNKLAISTTLGCFEEKKSRGALDFKNGAFTNSYRDALEFSDGYKKYEVDLYSRENGVHNTSIYIELLKKYLKRRGKKNLYAL